jgi:hypothetical protein
MLIIATDPHLPNSSKTDYGYETNREELWKGGTMEDGREGKRQQSPNNDYIIWAPGKFLCSSHVFIN